MSQPSRSSVRYRGIMFERALKRAAAIAPERKRGGTKYHDSLRRH
jgi:hypothetical protein